MFILYYMLTLILTPDDELSLVKFQKKLIATLNNETTFFYAVKPLWVDLFQEDFNTEWKFHTNVDFNTTAAFTSKSSHSLKNELKSFSKTITNIDFSHLYIEESTIFIKVNIKTSTKEYECSLPFLQHYPKEYKIPLTQQNSINALLQKTELPFKKIKIFRLGISEDLDSHSKAIKEFVWVKINSQSSKN